MAGPACGRLLLFRERALMELGYVFIVGLILGFGISIPVGPINLICVQRTLNEGRKAGFIAGLGAATADSIYGLVAAVGISFVAEELQAHNIALRVLGGLLLIVVGAKTIYDARRGVMNGRGDDDHRHWIRDWASHAGNFFATFILTLTNPITILAFAALFTGLGLSKHDLTHLLEGGLWLGVFIGASAWWWTVVLLVSFFRNLFNAKRLVVVNRVAGGLMAICGLFILVSPFVFHSKIDETAKSEFSFLHLIHTDR